MEEEKRPEETEPEKQPMAAKKAASKKKNKECALCRCPLASSYSKRLCQDCIEKTLAEESPNLMRDIRSLIKTEVKESLKTSKKSKKVVDKTDSEPDSVSEEDRDDRSEDSSFAEEEQEKRFMFPVSDTEKLLKTIRATLELEDIREDRSVADAVFEGLREKKRRCFPLHKSISALIEREWKKPDKKAFVSKNFKRKYPFEEEASTSWDKAPKLDVAISKVSRKSSLPFDDMGFLKDPLDKKIDSCLRNTWGASTASFRPNIAATVTARSLALWLERLEGQLRDKCPRDQILNSLPTLQKAVDFLSDASVEAVRLAARSASTSNSARRALWLKNWRGGDMASKQRLCGIPCQGQFLFGPELDALLEKAADRKKRMPQESSFSQFRPYRRPFQYGPRSQGRRQLGDRDQFPRPRGSGNRGFMFGGSSSSQKDKPSKK
ncbi:uncharacterized protein LOC122928435 isoform X2 [Bufo gargarizans]|uniref:uncharacterized protein LOC122928435 isoform X2 n=1 Tax=Bufo gargarizans TaxID=30331 RepID=UPI001CF377FA|nr:uncharacterized protein LOC122928435 isoform X2 [Bufo gargarizans]